MVRRSVRSRRYGANQTYHGRRRASTPLVVLVSILAGLLAVGLVFLFLMGKYIQYTDDGVKLELPWRQERDGGQSPVPDVSGLIITQSPESGTAPVTEKTPERIAALEVTAAEVTAGLGAELAARAGADALVVTVKDEMGTLAWNSGVTLPQADLNGDAAFSAAVTELAGSDELWLAARMPAFRDLWASVYDRENALLTGSGKLWYDSNGISWLSAARADARAYITSLCLELAELGFDEILLEYAGFPDGGKLSVIAAGENYPADREAVVSEFLETLSGVLSDRGVVLSILTTEQEVAGESDSGLSAAILAKLGRVWLRQGSDAEICAQTLAEAGMTDQDVRLVYGDGGADWPGSRVIWKSKT